MWRYKTLQKLYEEPEIINSLKAELFKLWDFRWIILEEGHIDHFTATDNEDWRNLSAHKLNM